MNDEKWQDIIAKAKDDCQVLEHVTEELPDGPGTIERIIFNGPMGKVRLERTTKPLVLDKKAIGSKRIGSSAHVEYVYSDTESVHTFKAYRWDEPTGTWVELNARTMFAL
ncbi:MAG: hypothetical protein PHY34_02155 [Patescibacteria group bacterium]|nr:hypothetical protein [Patescibacteria group bacterium]MDD5715264.1 hypothetical protein [Patescibacteria group bacterium]